MNRLPAFALYGESGHPGAALLHIESMQVRGRLHDWEIDAHLHPGLHQLLWLRQGEVEAMLDEKRVVVKGPAGLVIPPGVAHAFRFAPDSDGFVLTLQAALLAEGEAEVGLAQALETLFAEPRTLVPDAASPEVARLQALLEALMAEHQAADSAAGPVPRWLARAVVWRLAQWAQREPTRPGRRAATGPSPYTRWVVLMEAHYLAHWPVSRYAGQLGLSTERLNRLLRAETGQTAQQLLQARLAREACRRLVHVAAPVSQLAFELGFEDPAYFCRFFKRHTGCSPREYRQQVAHSVAAG